MEAVGGICHEWRREAKVMRAHFTSQSGVGAAEFQEAGDFLGQLVRCCRWLPRYAYSRGGSASECAAIARATVAETIESQTRPARGNAGCFMCASGSGSTSAATGHENARERRPDTQ